MNYLHEYAEQCRHAPPERRRSEWAATRADIDRVIRLLAPVRPQEREIIVRAYTEGFRRAAALAHGEGQV